jgi:putative exosortase-associated protein (TIGR04073 family)
MKKVLVNGFAVLGLTALLMGSSVACFANDPFTKLGRGVANTLTGVVEVPKNIYTTSVEDNALAGVTLGLVKGVGMGIARIATGLFEVVTFPLPVPEGYKPILEPEYVF